MLWKGLKVLLKLGLFCLLVFLGWLLGGWGFEQVRSMRELERVPRTETAAVLPGEVNLSGTVRVAAGKTLQSPDQDAPCVYYHYVIEGERTDSEGDRSWSVVHSESKWVPFDLEDEAGRIRIDPADTVDWKVEEDSVRYSGDRRYTEYRLDAGDPLFCFGYAEGREGDLTVGFTHDGAYTPMISQDGEEGERGMMAFTAVMECWLGLVFLSFAVVVLVREFRVHRIIWYLSIVTIVIGATLTYTGVQMMENDLRTAHARVERSRLAGNTAIRTRLTDAGVAWDGEWQTLGSFDDARYANLTATIKRRVRRIRIDLSRAIMRTNEHRARFPERFFAPLWGVYKETPIDLPPEDKTLREELEATYVASHISPLLGWILSAIAVLVSAVVSRFSLRALKDKRHIENIPTSKVAGACVGLTEVKGQVVLSSPEDALRGPVSGLTCVWYRYVVEERQGTGKKRTWVTIEDRTESTRFVCRDDSGDLPVEPSGAEVITTHKSSRHSGNRRYTEHRLAPGDPLYALGNAGVDPATHSFLVLQKDERKIESHVPFILANISEEAAMFRKAGRAFYGLNAALNLLILPAMLLLGVAGALQATDFLMAALAAPFYFAVIVVALMYNDLVFLKLRVERGWANIDVALKKRFDLIPNLERVVKESLTHEKEVHEKLASLRKPYGGGLTIQAGLALTAAGHELQESMLGLKERYPQLKGNELVGKLMRTLTEIENDVALMREGYNQAVERHNTRILHIPEVLLARLLGYEEREYFRATAEVNELPPLAFAEDDSQPTTNSETPNDSGT